MIFILQMTPGAGQYAYGYGTTAAAAAATQQMGYWYPQGYPQMQNQFVQPQYYSQYYAAAGQAQQAQYMNSMRMQGGPGTQAGAPGAWQPGQTTASAAPSVPAAGGQPGQQPMVTYAMPQYPTQ